MTARTASSLLLREGTSRSPADILTAAGMVGRRHGLAMAIWSLMHTPSDSAMRKVTDRLAVILRSYMQDKGMKGKPRDIAKQTLAWWLHGTCKHCGGTALKRIEGTPYLSDEQCDHCHGTGRVPLQTHNNAAAKWLIDEMGAMTFIAEDSLLRKVGR